jgi:long-chain acyl-CoA synthetase
MGYSFDKDTLADIAPRSAASFGDAPALAMVGGEAISYRELDRMSLRAAVALARAGISKGDRVAILSENRPEWGIASLGIARAGAVAVPILTDFTAEQIGNILAHSGARAAFVSTKLGRKLEAAPSAAASPSAAAPSQNAQPRDVDFKLLPIEELAKKEITESETDDARLPRIESGDLAAIIYTSGTTGLSKGVMLTHRNFIADAVACDPVVSLDGGDLVLSILPLAHAYEYTIGFLIPMIGGSFIRYLDRPPSASALLPALATYRPTIMLSVPMVIEKVYRSSVEPALGKIALYKYCPPLRPLFERLAGLKLKKIFGGRMRFFGIGGAPLDPEVERFLIHARFPHAIGYGLTETAPIIAAAAVGKTKVRVAGTALPGADIRIAGGTSPGAAGEIQVRGPMVGPGYYRDQARTAEAFTQDGYFRTGDLGSFDSRHRLTVRGRLKTMILGASGENIYPEEVESVINASPYVAESLVYGGDAGLTALVQLKPEILEELSAYAREGIGGADKAAGRFGQTVGAAIRWAAQEVGAAEHYVEKAAAPLLERVRNEANARLAAFSRISRVEVQAEPFEKTPTQKIKRFLYPRGKKD